jgi:hypothetical protein
MHTGPWGASGARHPRALISERAGIYWQTSGEPRRENAYVCSNVIASEAKQSILSLLGAMDCFASLAMTS